MPILRRFWDSRSGTCSYLLGAEDSGQAILIDPVRELTGCAIGGRRHGGEPGGQSAVRPQRCLRRDLFPS